MKSKHDMINIVLKTYMHAKIQLHSGWAKVQHSYHSRSVLCCLATTGVTSIAGSAQMVPEINGCHSNKAKRNNSRTLLYSYFSNRRLKISAPRVCGSFKVLIQNKVH